MQETALLEMMRLLVLEFGKVHAVDTSEWDVTCTDRLCSVKNIPSAEHASAFREYIRTRRDFMTDIAPPDQSTHSWTVVAAG